MDPQQIPQILSRWVHLVSVIILVGGATFLRFVLMPAAARLPDNLHAQLRTDVLAKWRKFVHPLVALIVITGVYNIVVRFQTAPPVVLWHMLITVKVLLALGVLFIASALAGRSAALAPLREKSPFWLKLNIAVALVVVLVSAVLSRLPAKFTSPP
jgi:uncharacterized membrane protein